MDSRDSEVVSLLPAPPSPLLAPVLHRQPRHRNAFRFTITLYIALFASAHCRPSVQHSCL